MYLTSEWNGKIANYAERTVANGEIVSKGEDGFFIRLEEGIIGMANFVTGKFVGDNVMVYIKKIDSLRQRIKLKIINSKKEYIPGADESLHENRSFKEDTCKMIEEKKYSSPFACYPGEERKIEMVERPASMGHIAFDMMHGYVPKELYDVLKIVNNFKYVTSKQITQLLEFSGVVTEVDIKKILTYCARKEILSRSRFVTSDGTRSNYYVYHMNKNGYNILRQEGVYVNFKLSDLQDDAAKIKQILSANQYAISKMAAGANIVDFQMNKIFNVPFEEGNVARVNFCYNNSKPELFVSFRRGCDWESEMMDKMSRIYRLVEQSEETNMKFEIKPLLTLCVEDEKHAEIIKDILKDDEIHFVTDGETYIV